MILKFDEFNSLPQQVAENKENIETITDSIDEIIDTIADIDEAKQDKLIAGTNIVIEDNVISAVDTDTNVDVKIDGVSIVINRVADILSMNGDYNASTNKFATANDLTNLKKTFYLDKLVYTNEELYNLTEGAYFIRVDTFQFGIVTSPELKGSVVIVGKTSDNVKVLRILRSFFKTSIDKDILNEQYIYITKSGDTYSATASEYYLDQNTTIDSSIYIIPNSLAVKTALDTKQETLVSGTNIKTINNTSLLGSGDITISGGGTIAMYEILVGANDGNPVCENDGYYIVRNNSGSSKSLYVKRDSSNNVYVGSIANGETYTILYGVDQNNSSYKTMQYTRSRKANYIYTMSIEIATGTTTGGQVDLTTLGTIPTTDRYVTIVLQNGDKFYLHMDSTDSRPINDIMRVMESMPFYDDTISQGGWSGITAIFESGGNGYSFSKLVIISNFSPMDFSVTDTLTGQSTTIQAMDVNYVTETPY